MVKYSNHFVLYFQIDYLVAIFGTIVAGGVVAFVNSSCTTEDAICQFRDSGAKYIFTCPSLFKIAIGAATKANIPKSNIFSFDDEETCGIKPYSFLMSER